jgi:hypothetical protein
MDLEHALPLVSAIQPGHGPQPTPVQISCGTTEVSGKVLVVIQVSTSSGVQFLYVPAQMARNVAQNLKDAADIADNTKIGLPVSIIGADATFTIGRKS